MLMNYDTRVLIVSKSIYHSKLPCDIKRNITRLGTTMEAQNCRSVKRFIVSLERTPADFGENDLRD